MKSSSKNRVAGRRVAAATLETSEMVRSAPSGAGLFDISKKDASGKVMIGLRGGRTKVPANMVNLVIRAATELLGLPYELPGSAKGQPDAAPASKRGASKSSRGKASEGKASEGRALESRVSAVVPAPQKTITKKAVVKKAASGATTAGKAVSEPVVKRRRGRRKAEDQIQYPPQLKSKVPESIRDFNTKYESPKGQTPPASLARRYFEEEKKWGYDAMVGREIVGKLLFVHPGPGGWSLVPTDERLAERSIKPTLHASPVAAFVRVTNGWSRAISGQSEAASVQTATAA